ncbi:MAG: metallophosphoesterase family protein [Bacteroidales bacterium]|nr:metallophosphoesterase family protein [Bacteroidales bacterium]MBN2818298.1 metallophosphoesterase family protein [Bacteroidales bacterium]
MKRIGILSDTHYYIDDVILKYFELCDEIWHAGDIGSMEVTDKLSQFRPLKAVYGNIDNHDIRSSFPLIQRFHCEEVDVLIKHIAGYPGRYDKSIQQVIENEPPKLLIAGHSHILKIQYDRKHNMLHINPGAAGKNGFHAVRTLVRLTIDGAEMKDVEVVELGKR